MRLVWSRAAAVEFEEIIERLEQTSADAAARIEKRILNAGLRLAQYPRIGRVGRVENTRELVVPGLPWMLVYRIQTSRVEILHIIHGSMNYPP